MESDLRAWSFKPNVRLVAVPYLVVFWLCIPTWGFYMVPTGPVFVAIFKPLGNNISVVMVVIFLGTHSILEVYLEQLALSLGLFIDVRKSKRRKGRCASGDDIEIKPSKSLSLDR